MARRGGTLERPDIRPGIDDEGDVPDAPEEVRPPEDVQLDEDDDFTAIWSCVCGYGNVGRERCIRCGKRAPAEVRQGGGLWIRDDKVAAVPKAKAGRSAWKTVAATIGLNLLVQIFVAGFVIANNLGLAASVKVSLFVALGYYSAVALWVLARSIDLGLRPQSGRSTALVGAAEGFIVGGGLALLLVAVMRVVAGRPVLDPTTAVLAAQSSLFPLIVGFVMIAMLGPIVEELVFRGFLAEAFRRRGRRAAIWISAVGFSLAHLRLSQFRYYVAMGVVFGLVYWRRGLVGSIAAHAAFNGMLVVVAVAATHGPAQDVRTPMFTATIPAAWTIEESRMGDEIVADSPLGSRVELLRMETTDVPDVSILARSFAGGAAALLPGITVDAPTVVVVDFPAGPAVAMSVDVSGYDGRVVMIPQAGKIWVATFRSGGEAADVEAFHDIVRSWRF